MIGPELIDYIKQCKASGFTDDQIKAELAKAGWSQEDINEAFSSGVAPQPLATEKPSAQVTSPETSAPVMSRQPSQPAQEVRPKSKRRFSPGLFFIFGGVIVLGVAGFFIWDLLIKGTETDLVSRCKSFNHEDLKTTFACQNDKYVVLGGETVGMPLCD